MVVKDVYRKRGDLRSIASTEKEMEENYFRAALLLTNISQRAVKVQFDREISPRCLKNSLSSAFKMLHRLKRENVINHT